MWGISKSDFEIVGLRLKFLQSFTSNVTSVFLACRVGTMTSNLASLQRFSRTKYYFLFPLPIPEGAIVPLLTSIDINMLPVFFRRSPPHFFSWSI